MRSTVLIAAAAALAALLMAGPVYGQLPGSTARGTGVAVRAEPPPYVTRMSDVEIPFSVKAGDGPQRQPTAVRIFVSWDRGQSWHFYEEKQPEEGKFRFQPKQDGEYWFATQTVDRGGQSDNPQPRQPQLRLVIDTQRPQLLAEASVARPGEVTIGWSAADTTLQPASLKIEYQDAAGSGGQWQSVPIDPAAVKAAAGQLSGKVAFEPNTGGKSINLRAEVADAAGNIAYYTQRVSLALPQAARTNPAAAPPPDRTATRWPTENQFLTPGGDEPTAIATGETDAIPRVVSNPFAGQGRLASSGQPAAVGEELPPPTANAGVLPPPSDASSQAPPPAEQPGADHSPTIATPRSVLSDVGPVESTADDDVPLETARPTPQPEPIPSQAADPPAATEAVAIPTASRPRLTSSRRFSLDYDVEAVGPEGLDNVELWGTSDGGRTWAKWGSDPDKRSPFDVEVNGEAHYGFRVVIIGKSGLASNAPHSGDAADIWVGIDMTRPTARLVSAAYGQGPAAGKLDIRWEAADANLTSRPVTLSIGDRPDGAFTPIAAGLPNSGQYYWEYDPRSPRLIYLRLEVRDEAGNVSIDQLTEPIRVEGLQPKGRIRGFAPGGEAPGGAFRQPLFR